LAEAKTTYGIIGVKVWVFKGEVFNSADAKVATDAQPVVAEAIA